MTALRALVIEVETTEGKFSTERTARVWFEHTKDIDAEIEGILKEVKKLVGASLRKWNRPKVTVFGTNEFYKSVDGYRYICDYPGETAYRKFDGYDAYQEVKSCKYTKNDGREADITKQVKELMIQMEHDIYTFLSDHARLPYTANL